MANLSDFLPAAAASGGIGKTITVGDYSYPNAIDPDSWYESATFLSAPQGTNYLSDQYVSSSSDYHYRATLGTSYTIIGNVTNATNGGALYFTGFEKTVYSTHTVCKIDVKITIDGGTAKEKSFYYSEGGSGFAGFYGWGYTIGSHGETSSGNNAFESPNAILRGTSQMGTFRSNYNTTNDFFYNVTNAGGTFLNKLIQLPAQYCVVSGIPYIYFATSCKIEMKKSGTYDENQQVFSGFATIYTF